MIKVSVIVPIYNSEVYLEKCLDSLVNQTLKEIEIILINDGSTDKSDDICKKYLKNNSNIIYLTKKNGGQASARNLGVTKAKGEYLSFVDSDDYIDLTLLEKVYNYGIKNDADIVVFDMIQVDDETEEPRVCLNSNANNIVKSYVISNPCPWNKIFKRSFFIFNNIKFLEGKIYEDLAIIPIATCYTDKIYYLNEYLYYYVIHNNSTMRLKLYNKKLKDIFFSLEFLENEFKRNKKYDVFIEEIEYIFIEHLLHGATLRFLNYQEGIEDISKIRQVMKEKYPHYKKNKYFKLENWKYRLICNLIYYNQIWLVKKLIRSR